MSLSLCVIMRELIVFLYESTVHVLLVITCLSLLTPIRLVDCSCCELQSD